jgi:hypothetical protein
MADSMRSDRASVTSAWTQAITLGGRFSPRASSIALTLAGAGAGLFFGWEWLVAAGLAPLLVAVLPCAAMCVLGLCASRMGNKDLGARAGTGAVPAKGAEPLRASSVASAEASAVENPRVSAPGAPAP